MTNKRTLFLHTGSFLLLGVVRGGLLQQLGFVIGKLGGSAGMVVLGTTAPMAVLLLTYLIIPWGERYPSRPLVALSVIVGSSLFLLIGLNLSPLGIAIVSFFALAVSGSGQIFYGRLLSQLYPQERRGRLSSVPLFARAVGATMATMTAGWILTSLAAAHLWLFPAMGALGVISGLLILQLPEGPSQSSGARQATLSEAVRDVLTDRPYVRWALIYSFINIGYWLSHAARPVFYAGVLELTYLQNGVALTVFNITYVLGLLFWGRVLDRVGAVLTLVVSWIGVGLGMMLVIFLPGYPWLLAGEALIGAGMAGNELGRLLAVLEFSPGGRVDRYMGLFMTLFGVRATLGSILGLILMEFSGAGSRGGLLVAATVMVTGSLAMLLLRARPSGQG